MELNEFKARLKSGDIGGAYLFVGEEEYLKRYYMSELRKSALADEALAPINHALFDGPQNDRASIAEAIESPPMMSNWKMVEWRHAEIGSGRGCVTVPALTELCELAKSNPYTVFAVLISDPDFDLGTPKKPSKTVATLGKCFNILRFDKSSDTQLLSWLKKHFDAQGIGVSRAALEEMLLRVGHAMDDLNHEVKKLCALAKARGKSSIDIPDVKEACSSNIECDSFALKNALSERNKRLAFTALLDMKNKKLEPVVIISSLASFYSELLSVAAFLDEGMDTGEIEAVMKIHPFRLKMAISAVKRYGTSHISRAARRLAEIDAASKMGGIGGYTAIEIFIAEYI